MVAEHKDLHTDSRSVGTGRGYLRTFDGADGLPDNWVRSIIQDRNGYIWFGTEGGACRYDGRSFKTFTARDGLAGDVVDAILEDRDGNLWFGTRENGVSRYDGQVFTAFTVEDGLADNAVWAIHQTREGDLWFGTGTPFAGGCGASRYDGRSFTTYTMADGLADNRVLSICQDRHGDIWFGTANGVTRFDGRTWRTFSTEDGLPHNWVWSIVESQAGRLWVGTGLFDQQVGGVGCYNGNRWKTFDFSDGPPLGAVSAIQQDRSGRLWFGTNRGLAKYDGREFTAIPDESKLSDHRIWCILQDREGHLWIGLSGSGAVRYDPDTLVTWTEQDGLPAHKIRSFLLDDRGRHWIGTTDGLYRLNPESTRDSGPCDYPLRSMVRAMAKDRRGVLWFGGEAGVAAYDGKDWRFYGVREGLGHQRVASICEDAAGHLWVGTHGGGVSRFDGGRWTTFTTENGLAHNDVRAVLQDHTGHMWFGTFGGGVTRYDGQTWTTYTIQDGLAGNSVRCIYEDRDGRLWFGTTGMGVSCYDGQHFTNYRPGNGPVRNAIVSINQDRDGVLWFGSFGGGVSRFDGQTWVTLTGLDGLPNNALWGISEDTEGHVWLATAGGLARYRRPKLYPPTVYIDAVVADQRYHRIDALSVPATTGIVAFEYHGMSLKTRPEAMAYRFRLRGLSDEWQNTGKTRVEYERLLPGPYAFQVQAVDRDLVYSVQPATVSLTVTEDIRDRRIDELEDRVRVRTRALDEKAAQLKASNTQLRSRTAALEREIAERERAELERSRLDSQLQELQYLYRLRSGLSKAGSAEEAISCTGGLLAEALGAAGGGGVRISLNGRVHQFGTYDLNGKVHYERPLVVAGKERGQMQICSGMELGEAHERLLLDETIGQIVQVLEARELEAQLLQSSRLVALGELAAGVAHELNQPLSVVSMTAGDIHDRLTEGIELTPEQLDVMMKDLLQVVARMDQTVDHMRAFSRDTSEEPSVAFCLNGVVREALKLIQAQLENHGVELALDLAEDLPTVDGHPHQVEQVVLNLLANARDALGDMESRRPAEGAGTGGWTKRILLRTCVLPGGALELEVTDNGIGVPEANRARVFEPFFTTKASGKGTGLGLSISHAIIDRHGGTIACESKVGEGTTFRVRLPGAKNTEDRMQHTG